MKRVTGRWLVRNLVVCLALATAAPPSFLVGGGKEDAKLEKLYLDARYAEIAKRYSSSKQIAKLSETGQHLLLRALIPVETGRILEAYAPLVDDEDLSYLTAAVILHTGGPVPLSKTLQDRLRRTRTGEVVVFLNRGKLPPASGKQANLRTARQKVLETFFLRGDRERRLAALKDLVLATSETFRNGGFSSEVPPPLAALESLTARDLALKLSLLCYLPRPERFLTWFGNLERSKQ